MNKYKICAGVFLFAVFCGLSAPLRAQDAAPPPALSQPQIDQMLAPIALYPDPLLSQILMAATYPLEVVEAARWQQNPANAALRGDQLAAALDQQPWDPSVKSLVPFPQVLHMLDANIQWTEQVGDAFLAQQPAVMDSVQNLRQRAQAAGNLSSTPQQAVETQGSDILIEPENPDIVYVPAYNPAVVYGAWPYPAYAPYSFYPDGYVFGAGIIGFGAGFTVIDGLWGWDHWDWRRHRIDIDDRRFGALNRGRPPQTPGVWHYDPDHRHGVPYRDPALRARFQNNAAPAAQRAYRGYGGYGAAANTPPEHFTPVVGSLPQRHAYPSQQQVDRPQTIRPAIEAAPPRRQEAFPRPQAQRAAPVFESYSAGAEVRAQSERGSYSRASMPQTQQARPQLQARFQPQARPQQGGGGGGRGDPHDERR